MTHLAARLAREHDIDVPGLERDAVLHVVERAGLRRRGALRGVYVRAQDGEREFVGVARDDHVGAPARRRQRAAPRLERPPSRANAAAVHRVVHRTRVDRCAVARELVGRVLHHLVRRHRRRRVGDRGVDRGVDGWVFKKHRGTSQVHRCGNERVELPADA
eukprot:CAMPEP_0184078154 /NCGR_PEP_ID=MMETSP0974-20121125/1028_1 /TAXON_ID=483370 /ORGANISM="non described non described, Strain CCMP2097" /LENGTH=160 /DNA_ID=CAMNT_0026380757 /DNA_START=257 /DNA_END=736 /DNA_ORIENTATION=-